MNEDFFAVRNEECLAELEEFLKGRSYNMSTHKTPSLDKRGKPLVCLGYKKQLDDPSAPFDKRGVVSFPNLELVNKAKHLFLENKDNE